MAPLRRRLALLALLATASACKDQNLDAAVEADKIWNERCVNCHGVDGSGNGPAAVALTVKPRSFRDPAWQASVDNARIKKVIVSGGMSVGLNEGMAPNPDLKGKDAVLDELVKKIRAQVD